MEELLLLFAINILCFWAGYRLGIRTAVMRMLNKILEDPAELQQAIAQLKRTMDDVEREEAGTRSGGREIRVETVNGLVYLYARDTDQFLAQGASLEEALEVVGRRFPKESFQGTVSAGAAKEMAILADKHQP